MMKVRAWTEKVIIPTYQTGKPERNPMFLEKRVYQGSSGVVYPHPVIEKIADEKADQEYNAVFLENEYLKIMILPELGGRIQRAYDKVKQRDFVYYNQVIKPALVGLAGPWISGGIEFNWPQHHRPSTFLPVDYAIEENGDGSQTVWINEVEIMFRTKGRAGFTLYPDKAFLEIKGKLFNRSAFPQTFLWWANPAVKVNEHYQSIFPPDVYAVFDHGKRDVSDFPIATGTYYKVDYAPGTDISRYDTIPVPTSYMAIQSRYDFMGCYEHDNQAGMLHVADHHFSPGKKQWTWGNGDFGFAWDKNLTDEDGPYIELMTGVFTDNQPDFSWLQPNEEKTFEQYFMPYAGIGAVKNATKEAMVNLEFTGELISIKAFTTAVYPGATISLFARGELIKQFVADISPKAIFEMTYPLQPGIDATEYEVVIKDQNGEVLVSYQPEQVADREIPAAASAAKAPADIDTVEELFLNGLHLEQYRHATFNPIDYYQEGLRRSPKDARCNNAMGLLLLRRGQFEKAEPYFRIAVQTLTQRNPNPYDGEPYYNLGWALKLQGKNTDAYDAYYKATWNDAFQHSSFLALARIATSNNKIQDAIKLIEKSLVKNAHSHTARHLKAALLRKAGQVDTCADLIEESLTIDLFNYGCLFEKYLLAQQAKQEQLAGETLATLKNRMRLDLNNFLELSLDYAQAGLFEEAIQVLTVLENAQQTVSPLVYYYLSWFAGQNGQPELAHQNATLAAKQNPDFCFPNKIEEVLILQSALKINPEDALAYYLLGNFWYDKRQYDDAITCWEQAVQLDGTLPVTHRNLSLAYYNKLGEKDKALLFMEKAFALNPADSRIFMELDQLYKIMGKSPEERITLFAQYPQLVEERDDLYLEKITLLNNLKEFAQAKQMLSARQFHPWEGGEGKVVGQFLLCHTELAKQSIQQGDYQQALDYLEAVQIYPDLLGEGKLYGAPENDINFLKGCALEGLGRKEESLTKFKAATHGKSEPVQAIYYNDPQPDQIVYQALSWLKLGQPEKATAIFESFLKLGHELLDKPVHIDYFAVSLPDMLVFDIDLNKRNLMFCKYLTGLGYLGLGDFKKGQDYLQEVTEIDKNHQGAIVYLGMIPFMEQITGSYAGN